LDPVELRLEADIGWIRFGTPTQRNLLTVALLEALPDALRRAVDARARVVVLRGRGDNWSAGYDVERIPAEIFAAEPRTVAEHPFERCMAVVRDCPIALVAAVQGVAYGGALELAASCDLVVAERESQFGLTPARLGLIYSHTGLRTLLRRVGSAHARKLVFTGRSIDALEAARIGLINEVCDREGFEARVRDLAQQIASCAPLSVRGMKHVLGVLEQRTELTQDELRRILALRKSAYESDDFREGQAAFRDKRAPRFRGR
jgi:enoyl-CoA hydratase/carnithine racemase